MKEKVFLKKNCAIFPAYYQTITPMNNHFVTTSTIAHNINVEHIYK